MWPGRFGLVRGGHSGGQPRNERHDHGNNQPAHPSRRGAPSLIIDSFVVPEWSEWSTLGDGWVVGASNFAFSRANGGCPYALSYPKLPRRLSLRRGVSIPNVLVSVVWLRLDDCPSVGAVVPE